VAFVGESGDLTLQVSNDLIRNGLSLHGSWHWNLQHTDRVLETIRKAGALIDQVITHTYPLDRVEEAFRMQLSGQCGKVILHPWG
jgi:threonine dehydrogenase-like Zn-dependent dehydrogenase